MNAPQTLTQFAATATADASSEFQRLLQDEYSPRYMLEGDSMDKMMRLAEQMATSKLSVPEHLRGNVGDCLAIITQAMLWNMNPFAVAQKTHVVSGRLGYEAQLVIAVVQASGAIRGAFRYEYQGTGANIQCRVGAVLRNETDVTWGEWLSAASVTTKNSPLWKTNVPQQMGYLQAKNWSRLYCPGAILGVYTPDELEQIEPAPAAPTGKHVSPPATDTKPTTPAPSEDLVNAAQDASLQGMAAYAAWFATISKDERKQLDAAGHHKACKKAAEEVDAEVLPDPAAEVTP